MNFRFQNLLGAPYRGGNAVISGNSLLISPVGNRVSVTDLIKSETVTLPCESSSNISRIAVSPDGNFLLTLDENNRCQFINLHRRVVLHRMSFKKPVSTIKFSPDGALIAIGVGKLLQIWRSPGFRKEFFPFQLIRTFADCDASVTALDWSPDSNYVLAGSKDLTVRLFCLKRLGGFNKPFLFLGHRDNVVGAFFCMDKKLNKVSRVYTISRDCSVFSWTYSSSEGRTDGLNGEFSDPPSPGTPEWRASAEADAKGDVNGFDNDNVKKGKAFDGSADNLDEEHEFSLHGGKWELSRKDNCMQAPAKLTACDYHRALDIVVVGFSNGVFGLYQMPDFVCIHLLSISREKISTAIFNELGNWLTFGCAKLGQLLVWEWRSESYILKQQGHYFDVNCLAYSSDSQLLATGADDNKIKVWTVSSGSCFVTFSEHTNAVTALHFMAGNHCLLSASLDGTVRAWDMFRYRNFRTFTTPSPRQFVSLASDQSGEVICAGTLDSFEIFVWSMKTGRLLDVLSGHEGPVHGLMFSPTSAILASSSWDKSVRLWDVFEGKGAVETFPHTHDVLTVVYRPDGKQLASSTLDGQIHFWDPIDGVLMFTIEGRRDIAGGRLMTDRRSAANSSLGKYFTTLCYSADGSYILAGGSSKYICMYDVADQVLLRRFRITHNLSLDGVLDYLNSKKMTEAGPLDLIDDDNSDVEEGIDKQTRGKMGYDLPGSMPNRGRPVVRTKCLRIAPTGRCWAAATTEGVLVYSIDESFIFDPTDLDMDVTPEAVDDALAEDQPQRALLLSLRLNEDTLIKKCIVAVKPVDIKAVALSIPFKYLPRLIEAFADLLESCPHLEFILRWCEELCKVHGHSIQQNSISLIPALRSLQKSITRLHQDLADTCSSNEYLLRYLCLTGSKN
ncbi:periodic tryptophan protein 2 [Macadamia integrifolia]|uniref:periodic tryptophan protein 2 n=1 Tax=Macadamia integrifolia TaxID=60698 RepID=UPI001C52C901|nr:periodic tryptophan protein 2 [Macadamia integrifolia]XP_042475575.1 periodic tryptophan protein 2 [Macadamia integrifolia]XP_042475576.1 periodic tryptophan protein 2 [Macadamia integrifolia]XP_042475577.1 periodic tryptophan protein 2 [Macadamia integrifolia]XP_042475578.1 periodic tryptophan protein 2 [Macadamia integrifolia]XP_042475579.1 periodic tryptophan protein 2 [Macadamia integrifolia]XP_042475580.1 periodic tryptophan protein 2 [Macadamia integrifolia]